MGLYCTNPAQHVVMAGQALEDLEDLDRVLSVRQIAKEMCDTRSYGRYDTRAADRYAALFTGVCSVGCTVPVYFVRIPGIVLVGYTELTA